MWTISNMFTNEITFSISARFVILPFFTLSRIHCLSICLKLNVMSVFFPLFRNFCEYVIAWEKIKSNIINHCVVCIHIRLSGYWLIIFNFLIFSLITQFFALLSFQFFLPVHENKKECSSKWNQNTISRRGLCWMQLTMIISIFIYNISSSFFTESTYDVYIIHSLTPNEVSCCCWSQKENKVNRSHVDSFLGMERNEKLWSMHACNSCCYSIEF